MFAVAVHAQWNQFVICQAKHPHITAQGTPPAVQEAFQKERWLA
eukprot:CAMPEP_0206143866 /NCGR_PEP_ID=MMETSP1473-20131121/22106_1 /ASSEMBLY_ACC=CAM_ASM_001109 /TAXON_ID=1461547 /ORGANISM="Stichococcus sp, Strain RCC1054" /LENGTH=43 /DNA_ID= /DNA_START= /DNA_END= /DNA_ORIENTATION=